MIGIKKLVRHQKKKRQSKFDNLLDKNVYWYIEQIEIKFFTQCLSEEEIIRWVFHDLIETIKKVTKRKSFRSIDEFLVLFRRQDKLWRAIDGALSFHEKFEDSFIDPDGFKLMIFEELPSEKILKG